jgi:hypothetical protein
MSAQMTPLRRRMIDDMTIRNMSPCSRKGYIAWRFPRARSPDRLTIADVRAYQLHLSREASRRPRSTLFWPRARSCTCP